MNKIKQFIFYVCAKVINQHLEYAKILNNISSLCSNIIMGACEVIKELVYVSLMLAHLVTHSYKLFAFYFVCVFCVSKK